MNKIDTTPNPTTDELSGYLSDDERESLSEGVPDVDAQADRYFFFLAQRSAEIARIERIMESRISDARRWAENERAPHERAMDYFRRELASIARGYKFYGKKKSASFPYGRIQFRAVQPTVEIEDMERAVAFAEERAIEVKVEKRVNKTPIKAWISDQMADGAEIVDNALVDGETGAELLDLESVGLRYVEPVEDRKEYGALSLVIDDDAVARLMEEG